jgi:nucleoside-diphosphate-sugar epimerase
VSGAAPSELSHRVVAVTGASGFVGSHIAFALKDAGHEVVGVVRNPKKAAFLADRGIALRIADVSDPQALAAAFGGADAVVANAAIGSGQGSLEDMVRTNRDGVSHTLEAAAAAGVKRVVQISSVSIYRTRLFGAIDESTPMKDTTRRRFDWSDITTDWRYAHSKTLAEAWAWELAARLGLSLTSLRPSPVYGSRDPKATARLAAKLESGLRFVPTVGVPWVHAGDVALATVGALANPATIGQAYNLAGPPISQARFMRALRDAIAEAEGRRLARVVPIPLPLSVRFHTRAAERDLGFRPRPLEAGIAEAVAERVPPVP